MTKTNFYGIASNDKNCIYGRQKVHVEYFDQGTGYLILIAKKIQ